MNIFQRIKFKREQKRKYEELRKMAFDLTLSGINVTAGTDDCFEFAYSIQEREKKFYLLIFKRRGEREFGAGYSTFGEKDFVTSLNLNKIINILKERHGSLD